MQSDDGIEECVEVVEQVDHLDGIAESWDGGEAHDVTEVQRDLAEMLGLHWLARLQRLGHRPGGGGGGGGMADTAELLKKKQFWDWVWDGLK